MEYGYTVDTTNQYAILSTKAKCPRDITPKPLQSFMLKYGFVLSSVGGSHFNYKHPELEEIITIPMHNPVKPYIISLVKEKIERLEEKNEKEL